MAAVAPQWAANRAKARREVLQNDVAEKHLRKYEAASVGRRTQGVFATGASANTEVASGAALMRNRARQMVRDNALAANAVRVIAHNTVGKGIKAEIGARNKTSEAAASAWWKQWAETTACDYDGVHNFYGLQNLIIETVVESGSALAVRRRSGSGNIPLQIQVLEPDFLDTTKDSNSNGKRIIRGKQYSDNGKLEGFWLYSEHPGERGGALVLGRSNFVPAADVAHVYKIGRPGQVDGVTWFAPVMNTLRDLMDTRDAYQLRQKISACFTAFIYDADNSGGGTGGGDNQVTEHMEPGRVDVLPAGKDIKFASPPGVDGMSDFDKAQQITIASGLGVPYEALSGDLRNVSFLSGRLGWLAFYRNIDAWRANMLVPMLCQPVFRWFNEYAEINMAASGAADPQLMASWTPPDRDLLDPDKEIGALRDEMRLGALPWGEMVRMRGRDPDKVLADFKRWNKMFDDDELVFDGDPRRVSRAGNTNAANPAAEEGGNEPDEGERLLNEALARSLSE